MIPAAALRRLTDDPAQIPPGHGFRKASIEEVTRARTLTDHFFQVWEPPTKGHSYVIGADVSDGLGQDRSVAAVLRVPTLHAPAEEVAQFVSDQVAPAEFAYILDAIGHWYAEDSGFEAKVAIETNNHGLSTQDHLQLHLGYRHFYRWEVMNSADPARRFTTGLGWRTTPASRPILLSYFRDAILTLDPVLNTPDLVVNSPYTLQDMRDFQTEGALWEAAAANGAYDDCVMALAIAYIVAHRSFAGESEPIADRRRRFHAIEARRRLHEEEGTAAPDFRNLPYTADDVETYHQEPDRLISEDLEALMDVRGVVYDGIDQPD